MIVLPPVSGVLPRRPKGEKVMTTVEVLRAARALIEDPERWTREALARFGNRHECDPKDERARCFCAVGAVVRVAPDFATRERTLDHLANASGIARWEILYLNDGRTHADVLAAFDTAIAAEEAAA